MVGTPVHHFQVDVRARPAGEPFKEIVHQFRLQIANEPYAHLSVYDRLSASAEIYRGKAQRFVHRHQEIAGAEDSLLAAQRTIESLAERNADVLHRVVLVDIKVPLRYQLQAKAAMAGKQFQHVIKKTN